MSVINFIWNLLILVYCMMYKSLFKWVVTKLTGRCELLRILYSGSYGAQRTISVESCLGCSNIPELRSAVEWTGGSLSKGDLLPVIQDIAKTKDVKPEVHERFEDDLMRCLLQLLGYQRLFQELDDVRKQAFNPSLTEHCVMMEELWSLLESELPYPGIRHDLWESLGFQCDEPYTDFRGMGLLSLHNLIYFASTYPETIKKLLSLSRHPQHGYSFAIVSINLTDLTYRYMREGRLKNHFYNLVQGAPKIEHFHDVYCWIFVRFDEFWRTQGPIDVMMFNPVKEKFSAWLKAKLRHKHFILRPAFSN